MTVEVLYYTPIDILDKALTKCWGSECKSDHEDMMKRIDRIINKNKHGSIAEHCIVNFDIKGISRACLQELARHRMQSLSVESTRYTLGRLKLEEPFCSFTIDADGSPTIIVTSEACNRAENYLVFTGEQSVDIASIHALHGLWLQIVKGIPNDKAKYCLPESFKTNLTSSWNIRGLANFFSLRTDKSALWEIRNLANAMFKELPKDYQYLLKEYVKEYNE